ncbi:MAG: hypothetical protein PHP97_01120 [Candidatus Shapirobacteria bacterium]|jgi:hypothetical protein|nr:hypothetical protein [Candidatus Shapirobacteria bacterium]MDD4382633.1 hypothetical protein [Candidatus Shapirobacteria bacterium]
MNRNSLNQIIKDRIFASNGKIFQELIWKILIKVYPDLQTPKMQHDLGNDGYSTKEKTFFACYAIEGNKYDNTETINKINDDYDKFVDNWKNRGSFNKWVFITKDDLMGIPHQTIVNLNSNNDGILKELWGLPQLLDNCNNISDKDIRVIFNIEEDPKYICNGGNQFNQQTDGSITNIFQNSEKQTDLERTIIEEIFENVLSKLSPSTLQEKVSDKKHLNITSKIALNFVDEADREDVGQYFSYALTKIDEIERRIQLEDSETQKDIESYIYGLYKQFTRKNISNIEILESLFREIIPPNKSHDPKYVNLSRAFVLLFFDDCTIFKKTKEEIKNAVTN